MSADPARGTMGRVRGGRTPPPGTGENHVPDLMAWLGPVMHTAVRRLCHPASAAAVDVLARSRERDAGREAAAGTPHTDPRPESHVKPPTFRRTRCLTA